MFISIKYKLFLLVVNIENYLVRISETTFYFKKFEITFYLVLEIIPSKVPEYFQKLFL